MILVQHIGATITTATVTSVQVMVAVIVICRFNYMKFDGFCSVLILVDGFDCYCQ